MKNKSQKCPECKGTGYQYHMGSFGIKANHANNGHGKVARGSEIIKKKKCKTCKGRRKLSNERIFEMRLKNEN